ncbi:hypothetical protein BX600DRAFT_164693 [Xylariales sp. PMI_506]|nr:hypothetical protein BX600DRAFT_164693 [Xylariales sp. PMI_506]
MNVNACAFCKRGKRKCDKARPACSNCVRLRKVCVYTEDTFQTHHVPSHDRPVHLPDFFAVPSLASSIDLLNYETIQKSTADAAMRILGSMDNLRAISTEFFTGTHQRIPTVSKFRFYNSLAFLTATPSANFAALCLSILLIQQMPSGKSSNMQSPLYIAVKNLIGLLEASNELSLDLAHARVLVTFYEMGHGLHRAAYISVAASARTARALGLHRKRWQYLDAEDDKLLLEEEKRAWWAIVILDRFISLCNGDALFAMNDPERTDPLPIEDLLWSEGTPADFLSHIMAPPSLETSFNITVGQMARECQISHLAGRVVRHVFDPTPDTSFNAEEAVQLERTLAAYLPLLANEELRIGKYCGAFGVCNSSLFTLYELRLSQISDNEEERQRIFKSIEDTSVRVLTFAEASYGDRKENYPFEILSPYLSYSLCQAGIIQHQLWRHTNDMIWKQRLDSIVRILKEFTHRWMVAWQYLSILENLNETSHPVALPFQGSFISTGRTRI